MSLRFRFFLQFFSCRSTGFVLEGFPRTPDDCQFLAQSGLYPDATLLLMVEDKDVIKRLLPGEMDKWIARRKSQNEKKQKIHEKKAEIKVFQSS